jgi:hypothetical protein
MPSVQHDMTLDYAALPPQCRWRYQWLPVVALVMGLTTGLMICAALQLIVSIPTKMVEAMVPNNHTGVVMCRMALYAIYFGFAAASSAVGFIAMSDSWRGLSTKNAFWVALAGVIVAIIEASVCFAMVGASFP